MSRKETNARYAATAASKASKNGYHKRLKEETLRHYGEVCVECGESDTRLLHLDHVDNNGGEQRKNIFGSNKQAGNAFYLYLKRNGYPKEPYRLQVLCVPCHAKKGNKYAIRKLMFG